MKDNISPEDKLLKLIKGDKKASSAYSPAKSSSLDSQRTFETSVMKSSSEEKVRSSGGNYFSILRLHRIINIGIMLSFAYLIISFIYPLLGLQKISMPDVSSGKFKIEESVSESKEEARPYEFYANALRERQIFSSPVVPESVAAPVVVNADLIKDIALVGVIAGENPQAVIENKKSMKTYYLTKGQFIEELQVEDIQEGKVVLNYKGQKLELYL